MRCGLRSDLPDFRKCVRTITLDPISEFLYWHMNWHLEHHMFAAVPCYNLPKLHQVVADDMPKPRTMLGAWEEMRETYRKQMEHPTYEFDTPVPVSTKEKFERKEQLEAALGTESLELVHWSSLWSKQGWRISDNPGDFKPSLLLKIVLQSGFLPVDSQIEDDSTDHVRQDN